MVERRQLEVMVVENMQLGMAIAEDGPLEQILQLEMKFQGTFHQYSWQVMAEDGEPVVLVVEDKHPELVSEEVEYRKIYEPPY